MRWLVALLALGAGGVHAQWEFSAPLDVVPGATAFFHVESAGRRNIAVSGTTVAVAWEDDRDGIPRCHVALKVLDADHFAPPARLSGTGECAEPVVHAVADGAFLAGWEEAGRVRVRRLDARGLGPVRDLAAAPSTQVSLGFHPQTGLFAAWSERRRGDWRIQVAALAPDGRVRHVRTVDDRAAGDQSYPSLAVLDGNRLAVAWEDRRAGHTRLYYAVSRDGGHRFSPPRQLNESEWRGQRLGFGRGTGVMRVALTPWREGVAAVWADKRDFRSGYDVYGAFADADLTFGANEKVQDPFGDNIAQWHPAIAGHPDGRVAVAWDDDRDGTPDIWLSWKTAQGWSEDLAVPGAAGPGVQSDPALTLDAAGNLHLVFLDKPEVNAPSRLRYVFGRAR